FFIRAALSRHRLTNPRVLMCAPATLSPVERRALEDAAGRAGAKRVDIVEEPIAAAIGSGFDIHSGRVFMLVDIGGGTTDIDILGFGGPVYLTPLRPGGSNMDEAIAEYMRRTHYLEIGALTAEAVKIEFGTAGRADDRQVCEIKGRDLRTGLPSIVAVSSKEI